MPLFIRLEEKDRRNLFNSARENVGGSLKLLLQKLNISRAMLFNYYSGKYDIPQKVFLNLKKLAEIKIGNYKKLHKDKYLKKEIHPLKINSACSEILGVLNGDGHISNLNHEVCVVSSSLEEDYSLYLKKLFEKNLGLKFNILKQGNKSKLRAYSKQLANLLSEEYGLPKGKKIGKLKIPRQVFNSRILLASYIRGLFDTDGTIYVRRKRNLALEIASADERFLKEVRIALDILGLKAGISRKNLYIHKKEDIIRFFETIKPANPKHLKKFKAYLKL